MKTPPKEQLIDLGLKVCAELRLVEQRGWAKCLGHGECCASHGKKDMY